MSGGNLQSKELGASGVTITSTGASTTNITATSAGTLDMRSGGTTGAVQPLSGYFELTAQWSTVTSIVSGTPVADLYLVPSADNGSNYATVDTTSGAGFIPSALRFGSFVNALASPSGSTNYRFATAFGDVYPDIYTVYIINRSGQTLSANWTLKFFPIEGQYT